MTSNVAVFRNSPRVVISRRNENTVFSERVRLDLDTVRMINGETPTPAVNGAQLVFTTAYSYVSGTLHVTRGSLRMHPTTDFSETSPSAGTFTMVVAPESLEPLIVDYIKT